MSSWIPTAICNNLIWACVSLRLNCLSFNLFSHFLTLLFVFLMGSFITTLPSPKFYQVFLLLTIICLNTTVLSIHTYIHTYYDTFKVLLTQVPLFPNFPFSCQKQVSYFPPVRSISLPHSTYVPCLQISKKG